MNTLAMAADHLNAKGAGILWLVVIACLLGGRRRGR